jgi:hypothetical protein
MNTKPYSLKIEPKGKAQDLHEYVTKQMEDSQCRPLDAVLMLLDLPKAEPQKPETVSELENGILLSELGLDVDNQLSDYGNKTEIQLVNDLFVDKAGLLNIDFVKRCLLAQAKSDFSRSTGKWSKQDKQIFINNLVQQQMDENTASENWFDKELINTRWISVNCNTSMLKADKYVANHQQEIDVHNQTVRFVDGKDLGKYFNRSARSAKKKQLQVQVNQVQVNQAPVNQAPVNQAPVAVPVNQLSDPAIDEEILGADGQPL